MKAMRYLAGWIVVTAVVTLTAWQVVGAAASRVSDAPAAPLIADASLALDASTVGTITPSISSTSSTVVGPSSTSSTSTTRPPTSATQPSGTATIPSAGGTVTVSYSGGQVFLEGASPAIGYSVEVDKQGPEEVKVEFESAGGDVTVIARWSGGRLVTEIKTSDH